MIYAAGRPHSNVPSIMQSDLAHPNVVKLLASIQWTFDSDAHPKSPHMVLVMDHCLGSLEDKLGTGKGRGALRYPDVLHVTRDCAAGLSYMRRRESMHRDIKARNVRVSLADRLLQVGFDLYCTVLGLV